MPSTYSYFFKKIFVVFLIVWFWVWYMHTWAQIQRPEEVLGSPELELQVIMNNLTWELGTELESLQTQRFLTTEPPLQPFHLVLETGSLIVLELAD